MYACALPYSARTLYTPNTFNILSTAIYNNVTNTMCSISLVDIIIIIIHRLIHTGNDQRAILYDIRTYSYAMCMTIDIFNMYTLHTLIVHMHTHIHVCYIHTYTHQSSFIHSLTHSRFRSQPSDTTKPKYNAMSGEMKRP